MDSRFLFFKPNDFNNYCSNARFSLTIFFWQRGQLGLQDWLRMALWILKDYENGCNVTLVPLVVVGDRGWYFLCETTRVSGAAEFLLCRRTAQSKMVSKHVTWRNIRKPFWLMVTIVLQFFKAIQSGWSCINSTLKSQLSNKTGYCFAPAHLHFNWMKITDRGALWRHGSRQKLGRQEARAAGEGEWAEGRQWKTHIVHPRTHS